MNEQHNKKTTQQISTEDTSAYIPAIKLFNKSDKSCSFEKGKIPTLKQMNTTTFWISTTTEDWEKNAHPAPRRQYVITIRGHVQFKVTDGSTFIIKPGIVLLAEDLEGEGHSWEMVKGTQWERLYIPITEESDNFFISDNDSGEAILINPF